MVAGLGHMPPIACFATGGVRLKTMNMRRNNAKTDVLYTPLLSNLNMNA
jgi:hypothetical protein